MVAVTLASGAASACSLISNGGGGLGATNRYRFGATSFLGRCVDKSISTIPLCNPTSVNALTTGHASIPGAAHNHIPNAVLKYEFGKNRIRPNPAFWKVVANSLASEYASVSPRSYSINTSHIISKFCAIGRSNSNSCCLCAGDVRRHAVNFSISAARSLASPAAISAFANRSFERSRSTLWRWDPRNAKSSSPPTPIATAALGQPVGDRCKYGKPNSAPTPTNTAAPKNVATASQRVTAPFSVLSQALLLPPHRRRARRAMPFLVGVLFWSGILALLVWIGGH